MLPIRPFRPGSHPGHRQGVEVAARGALGDLQLDGDLRRGHLLALLQQEEDGHQTISSHVARLPRKPVMM